MFPGFPADGLQFLRDLEANNNREWFQANKSRYEQSLLEPAVDFVTAVGSGLQRIEPDIQIDTRTNGQGVLMRIYRDVRFSKDKTPYSTAVNGIFGDGRGRKPQRPGFGFYLDPEGFRMMAGMFAFDKPQLAAYRAAVEDEKRGAELTAVLQGVLSAGPYGIGGEKYKRVPAGYDPDHRRADLLRYGGLYAYLQNSLPPALVTSADLAPTVVAHYTALAPVYRWLEGLLD